MKRSAVLLPGALLGVLMLAFWATRPPLEHPHPVAGQTLDPVHPDRDARSDEIRPRQTSSPDAVNPESPVGHGTPDGAILLRVFRPDGLPVEHAQGRIWRSRRGPLVREKINVRNGYALYPLGPEVNSPLWIELYGAPGCGAMLLGPVDPRPQIVQVRLPVPAAISGTALDEEGAPVAGLRVRAWAVHPELPTPLTRLGQPHSEAVSGSDGIFLLDGLGDRGYLLRVEAPPGLDVASPDPLPPIPAGTRGVEVRCRRRITVELHVLGPGGRPIAGAEVFLAGDLRRVGRTDGEGLATFEDVDPSKLGDLVVTPPDDREDLLPKTIHGGLPADRTVRLEFGLSLAGEVRDEENRPVPDAIVEWRRAGASAPWTGVRTDVGGRFRVGRVPPGPVEVRATPPDYFGRREPRPPEVVEAGQQDVSLVVGKTPMLRLRFEDWCEGEIGVASMHFVGESPYYKLSMDVGEAGLLRFAGLREDDLVEVFVRTNLGRVWLGRNLRPSNDVLPIRGLSSSKITGRLLGMPEDRSVSVHVTVLWSIELSGVVEPDGRFEIAGVPPGRWPLEARTTRGDEFCGAQAEVAAGMDVRIEMTRR